MSRDLQLFRRILVTDLRIYFRSGGKSAQRLGGLVMQLLMLGFLHFPLFFLLSSFGHGHAAPGGAEFAVLLATLLILAAAFQRSLETLYNRGDLPLLLSSPVPLHVIVATRLADIAFTTFLGSAVFIIPTIDVAALLFGPHWLWAWLAWLAATAVLVPLALAFTLALVRRIGARRARVGVQLLGIVIGVATFAGFQASNWMTQARLQHATGVGESLLRWFAYPPFTLLADAARGHPLWLALLTLAGANALWWARGRLARDFAAGAQATAGDAGGPPADRRALATAWRGAFTRTRWATIVRKELRLVFRDPLLLARSSTQIVMIIPALASAFLYRPSVGLAGVALVGTAMSATLLAALMTTNDEAPEYAATSPLAPGRILAARALAATIIPTLLGWILALIVLFLGYPFVALVAALGATLNSGATAWLTTCTVQPHTAEERAKNKQPMIIAQTFFGMIVGGLGAGGIGLWVAGKPVPAVALLAVSALAAAAGFIVRPRRTWSVG